MCGALGQGLVSFQGSSGDVSCLRGRPSLYGGLIPLMKSTIWKKLDF